MTIDREWRFARARALAADASLDGLYVTAGPNFRWLSGEEAHPGGWPLWLSAVLVPVEGQATMVISKMHAEIFDVGRLPVGAWHTYVDGESPEKALLAAADGAGLRRGRVGADPALWLGDVELVRRFLPDLAIVSAPTVFSRLRAVKDAHEIEMVRRAARAHDAGYEAAREILRPGVTVARAGFEIVGAMIDAGSEELSIAGSFTHLSDRTLEPGEIVDVDLWPGSHRGYRADSARNFFLGEPTADAVRLYEATHRAYDAAVAAVRPGVTAESVHEACATVMREAGYEQVWKVGHGVGLADSHEAPLLQSGNTELIEENMVFTIDPGAFLARATPIHIEDTVVVTSSGCESLNHFPRDIQVLG